MGRIGPFLYASAGCIGVSVVFSFSATLWLYFRDPTELSRSVFDVAEKSLEARLLHRHPPLRPRERQARRAAPVEAEASARPARAHPAGLPHCQVHRGPAAARDLRHLPRLSRRAVGVGGRDGGAEHRHQRHVLPAHAGVARPPGRRLGTAPCDVGKTHSGKSHWAALQERVPSKNDGPPLGGSHGKAGGLGQHPHLRHDIPSWPGIHGGQLRGT